MHLLKKNGRFALARTLKLLLVLGAIGGCGEPNAQEPADKRADDGGALKNLIFNTSIPSSNYFLLPDDIEKFRPGRTKEDVLKDMGWRGDFGIIAEKNGDSVTSITYLLVLQTRPDTINAEGEWVYAIFVNDKFEKFLPWQPPQKGDLEEAPYEGTTRSRPKPIKVGDISLLIREVESEPLDMTRLQKELKERPAAPSQVDPGLTAVFIFLKATSPAGTFSATEKDIKRNAHLRDQFNAARLKLGMSPKEVRAVFKAKALESGEVPAGTFEVYGSTESFNIDPALLYSNVLVLYQDGKATVIYGIEGGSDWRQKAQERFVDLPHKNY